MLDLDSLASNRAKTLNQKEDAWLKFIWSKEFQSLSSHMSDGEVEALVGLCPSVVHLEKVVQYLDKTAMAKKIPPFTLLNEEARTAGLEPAAWVERFAGSGA